MAERTLVIVVAHVVILFIEDPTRQALLDARTAPGRARAGTLAARAARAAAGGGPSTRTWLPWVAAVGMPPVAIQAEGFE